MDISYRGRMGEAVKKVLDFCRLEIKVDKVRIIKAAVFAVFFYALVILNPDLFFEQLETGETQMHFLRIPQYIFMIFAGALLFFVEFKLPNFFRKVISVEAALLFAFLLTYLNEWINGGWLLGEAATISRLMGNVLCCWLIFAVFLMIVRRIHIAAILTAVAVLGFGIATYHLLVFRGTPILPWDFNSLGTAMEVAEGYALIVTNKILQSVMLVVISLRFFSMIKPDYKIETAKGKILGRAVPALVAMVLFTAIIPFDVLTSLDINIIAWNQPKTTRRTGVTAAFFGNLKFIMVKKPEEYSAGKVEELKAEIEKIEKPKAIGKPEEKPTIIVVMNEALADVQGSTGYNIQFIKDDIPYIRELMESNDTVSGAVYASVFGGDTCNSEYEFLSGNSTLFFPTSSKPYQQYVGREQTTLVSSLISQGYDAIAIHPGAEAAWQRNRVYPFFGFEKFVYRDIFDVEIEDVRQYASDKSCYEQVIFEYENRKDSGNPLFIFNVTIQNHGGYREKDFEDEKYIEYSQSGNSYAAIDQYMTLTKKSDKDLKMLIDYFENEEKPALILFYGDHWPMLSDKFMAEALDIEDMENRTVEEIMRSHRIPYFMWANYPLSQDAEIQKEVSLNQLAPLLVRAAGLELTPYQKYLTNMSKVLPVITGVGMIDAKGGYYQPDEESPYTELIKDYAVLIHNNVFDKDYKDHELFGETVQVGK